MEKNILNAIERIGADWQIEDWLEDMVIYKVFVSEETKNAVFNKILQIDQVKIVDGAGDSKSIIFQAPLK